MEKEIIFGTNKLYGKIVFPDGQDLPARGCLLIHGLTGDHSQRGRYDCLAQMFSEKGIASLRFDCRGRGKSEGIFTIRSMIEDIREAYQCLKEKIGVDSPEIFSVARGEGAFASLVALWRYPIVAKIFWAAIMYPRTSREIQGHYHEYRQRGYAVLEISRDEKYYFGKEFFEDLDERDDAYHFVNPDDKILFIHPEEDEIHPLRYIEEFIEQIQRNLVQQPLLRLIKGVGHPHKEGAYRDDYLTHTINFIDAYLLKGRETT